MNESIMKGFCEMSTTIIASIRLPVQALPHICNRNRAKKGKRLKYETDVLEMKQTAQFY
jgi:hypothetical protein